MWTLRVVRSNGSFSEVYPREGEHIRFMIQAVCDVFEQGNGSIGFNPSCTTRGSVKLQRLQSL